MRNSFGQIVNTTVVADTIEEILVGDHPASGEHRQGSHHRQHQDQRAVIFARNPIAGARIIRMKRDEKLLHDSVNNHTSKVVSGMLRLADIRVS